MPRPSWTIAIMAFNEEATLAPTVERSLAVADEITDDAEIVVVDDGSTDATGRIADELGARHARVRVVRHPRNLGIGEALRSGYAEARKEIVTVLCADLQFDPAELKLAAERLPEADAIAFYRTARAETPYRTVVTHIDRGLVRLLFGLDVRDLHWVKVYRRSLVERVRLRSRSPTVDTEMLVAAKGLGARIVEVPSVYHPRRAGLAKGASLKNVLRSTWDVLSLWPYRAPGPPSGH